MTPRFRDTMTHAQKLHAAITSGVRQIGEVWIEPDAPGDRYKLCHINDRMTGDGGLVNYAGPLAARELSLYAADGGYRFLKGQRNLRAGWVMVVGSVSGLLLVLDQIYPACVGLWLAQREGVLEVEDLRDKLKRQSGIYRRAQAITDDGVRKLVATTCRGDVPCGRRILWQIDGRTPLGPCSDLADATGSDDPAGGRAIPLICREACNHFVAECLASVKRAQSHL